MSLRVNRRIFTTSLPEHHVDGISLSHTAMSSPDVVIGVAELGSSALTVLLSSQTSIPAVCTRSFSTVRSVHRRATVERSAAARGPVLSSATVPRRPTVNLSVPSPFSRSTERHVHRSFTSRSPNASFSTSSPSPSNLKPPTTSSLPSPPPARLPSDHDGSSVLSVANPRLFQPPSFISDAAQHLTPEQHDHLSQRLDALNAQLGTQLAVVTVRSVLLPDGGGGGGGVRGWAVRLFNQWGVGMKQQNDGILVLLVEKQRRIEVVLGDGCKQQYGLSDAMIQRVVDERMVPWLKRDEYGMGLVEGVNALEQLVRQSQANKPLTGKTTLITEQPTATDGGIGGNDGGRDGGAGGGGSGGTGWGGGGSTSARPPFDPRVMKGVLAVVAGFIALRMFTGPSNQYSTSSSAQPSRCSRCQGKLKLAGIVDRNNLYNTNGTAFNSTSDLQSIDRPDTTSTSASFPTTLPSDDDPPVTAVDRNVYLPDYRVDYQHALDSLTAQQVERLRQAGVVYSVYVCPDCSTLYLQEGGGVGGVRPVVERGDRMYDRTVLPPVYGRGGGPLGMGGVGGVGGVSGGGGGGGGAKRGEVVWLPSAEPRVKGVRREADFGASSSGSSGFGGGTSSGGGGGASF